MMSFMLLKSAFPQINNPSREIITLEAGQLPTPTFQDSDPLSTYVVLPMKYSASPHPPLFHSEYSATGPGNNKG